MSELDPKAVPVEGFDPMLVGEPLRAPSETASLAKGASVNLVGRILGQGIQFTMQVLLARLLGPVAFGLYSIGWLLLRLGGGLVAPLALDDGVLRFAPQIADRDSRALSSLLRLATGTAMLAGLVIGGLVLGLAPFISEHVYHDPALAPVLRAFAPAFALLAGLRVTAAETRITQRMEYSIGCEEIAQPIVQCLLFLALFFVGGTAVAAAAATSLSLAVAFGLAVVFLARLFPVAVRGGRITTEHSPQLRELLAFSIPTMVGGLALSLLTWLDQMLVGLYGTPADVGVYRCASISAIALSVILSAFNTMVSSQVANLHYGGHTERLASLFRTTARWGLYLGLPPFLVMCFAPAELLSIFGPAYERGAWPLIILAAAHLSHVIGGPAAPTLVLTGSSRPWTAVTVLALAANVVLNILWIPASGAVGAAGARAITLTGWVFACLILIKRKLGFWPWDGRFMKGVLASALTASVLWLIRGFIGGPPLLRILAVGTVASSVFFVLVTIFGLDDDDRRILDVALNRFRFRR